MAAPHVMSTLQQPLQPQSHVGFDSITSQIERKLLKRGFQFNVICVGSSSPSQIHAELLLIGRRQDWGNRL